MITTVDKFAAKLRSLLKARSTESNVLVSIKPKMMGTLCLHSNTINMRLMQLLVLAKRGKDRHPLTDYDAELQLTLNKKRFFSSAAGLQFANQRGTMLESLVQGIDATMLCTSYYGLQEHKAPRSRLWTVNVKLSKKRIDVCAVFGHCDILPAVLYDVVAVDTIAHWFGQELSAPVRALTLFFHSLKGNGNEKLIEHKPGIKDLPATVETHETLRIEESLRETRPKVAPIPNVPLPKELDELLKEIHTLWREKGARKRTR